MKVRNKIIIVLGLTVLYYTVDALIDFMIQNSHSFLEVAFTNIPLAELFNRLIGILLLIATCVFYFRSRKDSLHLHSNTSSDASDTVLTSLNSYTVIEMVAAQLKTTMNTVLGYLNLVKDKSVSKNVRGVFTEYVYSSSTSLLQLFNNLVELYHILNNTISKSSSRVNIVEILSDLNKKYETELKHRANNQLSLILLVPDEYKEVLITTDATKLISILESLMENAIAFSDEGSIRFGFTIEDQDELRFFFHDNGAGIPMEQLNAAFNSFAENPGGMDLGYDLAALRIEVASRLTSLIGAKLWSNSKPGKGSSYYFSLPVSRSLKFVRNKENHSLKHPDWTDKKILIAEDLDANLLLLKTLLADSKVDIIHASDGQEAVDIFEKHGEEFHAILMDIVMPNMDGFEAARRIKNMNRMIPIIGQTAYCLDSKDESEKLKHFDDLLTKPIWSHELIRVLSKHISSAIEIS